MAGPGRATREGQRTRQRAWQVPLAGPSRIGGLFVDELKIAPKSSKGRPKGIRYPSDRGGLPVRSLKIAPKGCPSAHNSSVLALFFGRILTLTTSHRGEISPKCAELCEYSIFLGNSLSFPELDVSIFGF